MESVELRGLRKVVEEILALLADLAPDKVRVLADGLRDGDNANRGAHWTAAAAITSSWASKD